MALQLSSKIHGNYLFLSDGYHKTERRIHVYDLVNHSMAFSVNVNDLKEEPEGLDVKDGWLYVAFHYAAQPSKAQYYRFNIKGLK